MPHISKPAGLILVLILLLATLLRFYHLADMTIFDADQEFAAEFAKTVLTVYPIRLIGQGLSVQGLFMGPWYFYLLVPFYALSHLYPLGGYLGSILIGLVTIVVYYVVGRAMFNEKTGLVLAFFRAAIFTFIRNDLLVVPSLSADLIIILTWYCLWKIWHGQDKFFPFLGFLFGFYSSWHPILIPFYFVLLAIVLIRRKLPSWGLLIVSTILFLIPIFPLALFEYFRKLTDLKSLFNLHRAGNGETKSLFSLINYVQLIIDYPVNVTNFPLRSFSAILLSGLIYIGALTTFTSIKTWVRDSFHFIALALTFVIFLLYYVLLPLHVPEYYLMAFSTLAFVYLGASLSAFSLSHRWLAGLLSLGITLLSFATLRGQLLEPLKISFGAKDTIVRMIAERSPDNNMRLDLDTDAGEQFGVGYLARYYNIHPTGTGGPHYTIVIPLSRHPQEISKSSGNVGLIID